MASITPSWDDRRMAGEALARQILRLEPIPYPCAVIGLPRGGVIVAAAVAEAPGVPLFSWAVRKLALPDSPELAIGAVAATPDGPLVIWNAPRSVASSLTEGERRLLVSEQWLELLRRQRLYGDPPALSLRGYWLVVVDDGIATGLTIRAALASLRQVQPLGLMLAVPVADHAVIDQLSPLVERLLVLHPVSSLQAVGCHYKRFEPVEDGEVLGTLARARRRHQDAIP